ncbi:RdRP protein [Rhizoctonia solani]|uniref:RNA-dependent RNA polymerase n=1 Tax=Rhizoctonia solani TaxID=456999 RepID=A0A8H7HH19_9AGAM|nr:RdRP protein [Rhizoctonia solani]
MHTLYFHRLPPNVAKSAFSDAIDKFIANAFSEATGVSRPSIHMDVLSNPTLNKKHYGYGSLRFTDEKAKEMFMAKLKTEPIMFGSETVEFLLEKPANVPESHFGQSTSSSSEVASRSNGRSPQSSGSTSPRQASRSNAFSKTPGRPNRHVMNLNRAKPPQFEKREVRPPNIKYLRKLHHRLSVLGQHLRLETLEFGVLRNWNFSVEYSRSLIEETGYFKFEDDEKSMRISIGGSHHDSTESSIAIAIQNVNYVALGTDFGNRYMFLSLSQNPQFELGNIARPMTGNGRVDARRCRDRLSALDDRHGRVAPYTSRWIKLTFHVDSPAPDAQLCKMAGLVEPAIDPPLSFRKLDVYSPRNIASVENWSQGGSLDWEVAFQVEALFRNGVLVPTEIMAIKPIIEALAKQSKGQAADALRTFRAEIQGAGARRTFNDFEDKDVVKEFSDHISRNTQSMPLERVKISNSNFMCYHLKITPTAVHLNGPLEEQSNRVIRRYPGYETHFIRVAFTDEADERTRFEYEVDTLAFTQKRVGQFLKNEILVCNRRYELLGYSQSGFRENACFYIAPFEWEGQTINGEYIRQSLGNFDRVIDSPSRYGARMSQAFSATSPSVVLKESEIKQIPELQASRKRIFSDGCATISRELAKDVWASLVENMPADRQAFLQDVQPPSAFQIRIGGSKGMVRLDPKLEGRMLCLRPSMIKFDAEHELSLEIARAFTTFSPCFLNRPLIVLLWSGGVEDEVFVKLMKDSLARTTSDMSTLDGVAQQLYANQLGAPFHLASTFRRLSRLNIALDLPEFRTSGIHKLLNATLFHIKRDLKHKARIKVPDSYTLVGVCDEDDYLRPRQIYACIQHVDHNSGMADVRYLEGRYLVTRSPVIHPGDAQVVWAIGKPPTDSPFYGEGNNLPNIVVFSTRGVRSIPSMLGGGDLELIPRYRYSPANYDNPNPKKIGRPSTINDVADFMVEYICHDALGMIATNHLVIASTSEMRARDENCLINAELHSKAVDFVKNGYYVANHEIRKAKYDKHINEDTGMGLKPDWQAGHGRDPTDGRYYECDSVLGKLFRAVELPSGNPARESEIQQQVPNVIQKCIASHVAKYKDEIKTTFSSPATIAFIQSLILRYTSELNHICVAHTISSESAERVSEIEVMLGTNLEVNSKSDLIKRMKSLTHNLANTMRHQLKATEAETNYVWLGRAWKAYLLTSKLGDETFGTFSFSWLALGSVLDALQAIDERFMPQISPIIPPFESTPSGRPKLDEDYPLPDYDNWNDWADEIPEDVEEKTKEKGDGQLNTGRNKDRVRQQGGWNNGRRSLGGSSSSFSCDNHIDVQNPSFSSKGQTTRSSGGRKTGYRIIATGNISF